MVKLDGTYTHPRAQTHSQIDNANGKLAYDTLGTFQDQVMGLVKEFCGLLYATRGKQTCS